MNLDDTIVAISTPAGRGGIGVVRLAGAEAKMIARTFLRLSREMEANRATVGDLVDPHTNERIDEVVATYFQKPHSYTTDDIVEVSCHGSPVVLRHAVQLALEAGARLAEPGEFTMRAFLNGRLDLTQAEAVRDLIDSQTLFQAKTAAQQLNGALSNRLQPIKTELVQLIAVLEAGIDFADDDVSVMPWDEIRKRIASIRAPLEKLEQSFQYGKLVHEGLTLAIVGRPNVGKSSLFNCLVEQERAIVASTPGTTRDLVTETVSIGGIPVKLVDTAGIRQAVEEAEHIGIRKSMEALADADLVLLVMDASHALDDVDRDLLDEVKERPAVIVHNKSDLAQIAPDSATNANVTLAGDAGRSGHMISAQSQLTVVRTSARTGEGIGDLREEILRIVRGERGGQQESGFLTSVRQQQLVKTSIAGLLAGDTAAANRVPHEMVLLDLYSSLRALDEITGATTADDILNLIFSTFCIGK